jgi:hypothetical protein
MKAKTRVILEECIENGVAYGLNRARKYTNNPTDLNIKSCIELAIWYEIDEKFDFDPDLANEVAESFDHLKSKPKSDLSGSVDVTLLEEHEDGSATYQFDLTPEYAEALLRNGIMWAIASGVTGITIDKVLEEHMKSDDPQHMKSDNPNGKEKNT